MRCSSTAGFQGSSRLMQALAARCRLRPTPPASVAKSTRHAGSSWNSTMFWVRRFWPSSPVKNAGLTPSRASWSRVAQCASRSMRRHWLKTTTLRPSVSASWPISSRSSRSFGLDSPRSWSVGRAIRDRSGQTCSKRSWARPLEMIRWVVSRLIRRRNSACVSGRRLRGQDLRDRLVERVVLVDLFCGHLDGNSRVGPRRELVSTSCRTRRTMQRPAGFAGSRGFGRR